MIPAPTLPVGTTACLRCDPLLSSWERELIFLGSASRTVLGLVFCNDLKVSSRSVQWGLLPPPFLSN